MVITSAVAASLTRKIETENHLVEVEKTEARDEEEEDKLVSEGSILNHPICFRKSETIHEIKSGRTFVASTIESQEDKLRFSVELYYYKSYYIYRVPYYIGRYYLNPYYTIKLLTFISLIKGKRNERRVASIPYLTILYRDTQRQINAATSSLSSLRYLYYKILKLYSRR